MIKKEPELITNIIIKLNTKNPYVISSIISAAVFAPEKYSIILSKKVIDLIKNGGIFLPFEQDIHIKLIDNLSKYINASDISYEMSILYLKQLSFINPNDNTSTDDYYFIEAINKLSPILINIKPKDIIGYLCDVLINSIKLKNKDKIDKDFDYSIIWRPAIEDHIQNHDYDLPSKLVAPLRDACEKAIQIDKLQINDLLQLLDNNKLLIFKRLKIHLLNVFADKAIDDAKKIILDKNNFDDYKIKHEYAKLIEKRFSLLNDDEQKTFKSWIETGPNLDDYIKSFENYFKNKPTNDEIREYIDNWKYNKYWWIQDFLNENEKIFFDDYYKKHGKPELSDLNSYSKVGRGDEETVPYDEIKEKTFKELIAFISSYKFKNNENYFKQDGLYSLFERYVKENLEDSIKNINELTDKSIDFTRIYFRTLFDKSIEIKSLDLSGVIKFANNFISNNPYNDKTSATRSHIRLFIEICLDKDSNLFYDNRI